MKPRRRSLQGSLTKSSFYFVSVFSLVILLTAARPEEKQLSVYSNATNYSLPVPQINGTDYVGIFEVLEPLGKVSANQNNGLWTLHYNNLVCDFKPGSNIARLQEADIPLGQAFVLQNGRGLVPARALAILLPKLLGGPVTLNEASRRLLIGGTGIHFTAQVKNTGLVMDFSSPVNPSISTAPGKLVLLFTHDALMPPSIPVLTFANKNIPSANFSENNGVSEITISATVPLFASFSNGGKTITIQPAPQQIAEKSGNNQTMSGNSGATMAISNGMPPRYFAIIDAAHGGNESGATLGPQLAEKDVTLSIARQIRDELNVLGVPVLLLRDDDTALTTDQRASLANQQHVAIYICIHASTQGQGVRLYTALIPAESGNHGPFLDWRAAQQPFLSSSQNAATVLSAELQRSHIPTRQLVAPLPPLNSIVSAAVGIEVAPPHNSGALTSPVYQQSIASSIASGIADLRHAEEKIR
jgi:N-acetylmuramoyl-L-alanine amidase